MYIIDFFKKLGRVSNIPVIIYLVLNVVLITFFLMLFELVWWQALLLGLGVYLLSITIALSPIGEWILRMQTGCKEITDENVRAELEPLFLEVYQEAREADPSIPHNVKLYMSDDPEPNAFATGRKTVCVTRGMMSMRPELIKATLGHEFGHLAHKDTDLILVVTVGNLIVSGIILFFNICLKIGHFFMGLISGIIGGEGGWFMAIMNAISAFLTSLLVTGFTWLWTKLGPLLVMSSSRSNEYEADAFSHRLGYGTELCVLLDTICGASAKGLFANLASSHPGKEKRIAKLRQLGVNY